MTTTSYPTDLARLTETVGFVREQDTATLLPLLLPGLDALELRAVVDRCRFSHAALLVFPPSPEALHALLADGGLPPDATARPSVVVRDRLAARHGRDPAELDVRILRPRVAGSDRTVEVFALLVPPGSDLTGLAEQERTRDHEAHLALEVEQPDPLVLRGLCALLTQHGATADGGGYNPHEDGTVLYFTVPAGSKTGYRRLELYVPGEHPDVLATHLARHRAGRPAETLLRQLTGAWTTQALAVCAELRLPDALDTHTVLGAPALARAVGADPDTLVSLLRYLAMVGVVSADGDGYRLTETGALLRTDVPASMRPLALMYGGPFYQSFAALGHTVRTGEVAFDHLHGENHFDHFARDPGLAALFDESMAASSRMFEPLTAHPAVTTAARASAPGTVVDVAGGNGELLGRLLAAHPGLKGVLLERPHAVEAARRALDAAGHGDRCAYVAGDFADVPAGGDVYLLSRILHDWDDGRCREILRHCARAMPAHADLLVVERVLPADDSPSLATAWDLHMRCNVGGRERRADHYARLFADAGLTLVDTAPLPLDATVLHVRKAGTAVPGQATRPGRS
ncbi:MULTISPECIES: methyltransferase [unclassified Kitasatospora]|uniref:methyltransferase n=1 Tax=unclassified Kitasatospora TaxID=2633591 RepID=UPI00070EFC7F|nr:MULTISPECIES: methyltransferase [unclassified Kitasatospora]KQV11802.1 methyltransferase [Kitasatospora sp. Root107]KRB76617.1 methyltransferase [Kitasatospora sp. Root187]